MLASLASTGIRQLAPGGKARAFGDIVADKLGEMETRQFVNLSETLLPFATGNSLDVIGEMFGVARILQQSASVAAADQNFRFYVRTGTFGAINNGHDIVIPADVQITTGSENGPVYLANTVTLPAAASEAYFSARSLSSGAAGNSPSSIFSRHNFSNYAESRYGSLLVTNMYGVVGGRDEEDDESYRYRIYLKIRSANSANEMALRFELLAIPGIQDVVFERQAGSFLVYVYSIATVASASLLDQVQQAINDKAAYPIVGVALSPDLVGVSLATTLRLKSGLTQVDKETLINQAAAAAENYINNLKVGEQLVINEIADRIRNADARILDVGEPNLQIPEIFIWRSRADGTRYSRFLVANYTPLSGERIVVEDRVKAVSLTVV